MLDNTCAEARANKKSVEILDFMNNYVKNTAIRTKNRIREKELNNLGDSMSTWIQQNVLGNININENKTVSNVLNTEISKKKVYNKSEKDFIKFLNEEVKDVEDKDDFSFVSNENMYKKVGNKFYQTVTDEVSGNKIDIEVDKKTFTDSYAAYIGEKASKLGHNIAVGSTIRALVGTKAVASLAWNWLSGVLNYIAGQGANRIFAASGRFGFNSDDYAATKNLFALTNIDRYLYEGIGLKRGVRSKDTALKVKTFKLFLDSFGLFMNRLGDIDSLSNKTSKEGFSMLDWSVNFAEFHNQGRMILAVMMNHFLEYQDRNGNTVKVPLYDKTTGEFVWKPGTLILKDEYRTPENVRIWENFKTSKDGNNPQLDLLFHAEVNRERSQGNYNEKDKPMIMASQLGRSLIMFKRYMFEQGFNQYGKIDNDIIRGGEAYEGRSRVMLKYAPATVLTLATLGFTIGSPIMAAAGLGFAANIGVMSGLGVIGHLFMRANIKKMINQADNQVLGMVENTKLSLSLISELLAKTATRPLEAVTFGKSRKLFTAESIASKVDDKLKLAMNKEQRKILSENMQDLSNLLYGTGVAVAMAVALRIIGELLTGAGKDDDDEEYKKKMRLWEQMINVCINRYGYFTQDVARFYSPDVFTGDVQPTLYSNLDATAKLFKSGYKFYNDEGDFKPVLSNFQRSIFNPVQIPNSISDIFLKEGKSPIQDPKIYSSSTSPLLNSMLGIAGTSEQNAKKATTHQREKITEDMSDVYKQKFIQELESMPQEYQDNFAKSKSERNSKIEELVAIAVKKEKDLSYKKRPQEKETEFYNRMDFKNKRKQWKDGTIKPRFNLQWAIGQQAAKKAREQAQRRSYENMYPDVENEETE